MSHGRMFIVVFRWILLLLATLTIAKSLDGIVASVRGGGATLYDRLEVGLPVWLGGAGGKFHWKFTIAILQACIIFSFLFRYFACLIEPITSLCRKKPDKHIDFENDPWEEHLKDVKLRPVLLILVIAVPEFFLIVNAAMAIPAPKQWATFLCMLVVFDLFFIVALHRLIALGAWGYEVITLLKGHVLSVLGIMRDWIWPPQVLIIPTAVGVQQDPEEPNVRAEPDNDGSRVKGLGTALMSRYLVLTLFDLVVVLATLVLLYCCDKYEKEAVGVMFLFTAIITLASLRDTKGGFADNIGVLVKTTA